MVENTATVKQKLLAMARGELPIQDLDSLGMEFSGDANFRRMRYPGGATVVDVSWEDLAVGFLHHYGHDSMEEWASFVIMAEYEIPEERSDDAEEFWQWVYEAAGGGPLDHKAEESARRLCAGDPS